MEQDLLPKIGRLVFSLIGIGLLLGAYLFYQHTQNFLKKAIRAEGEIVALIPSEDAGTHTPQVSFQTQKGEIIDFTSNIGSSSYDETDIGKKVTVLYLPENPQTARLQNFWNLWLNPIVLGGFSLIFLTVGLIGPFIKFVMSKF